MLGCFTHSKYREYRGRYSNVFHLWHSHLAFALFKHHFEVIERQDWFLQRGRWRKRIGCGFVFFLLFHPLLLFSLHVCLCFGRSLMGRRLLGQAVQSHGFAGGSRWFWENTGFAGNRRSHAQLKTRFLLRRSFPAFLQRTQVSRSHGQTVNRLRKSERG